MNRSSAFILLIWPPMTYGIILHFPIHILIYHVPLVTNYFPVHLRREWAYVYGHKKAPLAAPAVTILGICQLPFMQHLSLLLLLRTHGVLHGVSPLWLELEIRLVPLPFELFNNMKPSGEEILSSSERPHLKTALCAPLKTRHDRSVWPIFTSILTQKPLEPSEFWVVVAVLPLSAEFS